MWFYAPQLPGVLLFIIVTDAAVFIVSPQFFSFEKSRHPTLAKLLFFYFMLFVTVLLMNMLIAMMANTYQNVSDYL